MIFIPGHYSLKNTVALKRTAKCNGSGAKCLMAALFTVIPPRRREGLLGIILFGSGLPGFEYATADGGRVGTFPFSLFVLAWVFEFPF
jgi:hypothetical protein